MSSAAVVTGALRFNTRPHVKELSHPEKQTGIQTNYCKTARPVTVDW